MEFSTSQAVSNIPSNRFLTTNIISSVLRFRTSLPLKRPPLLRGLRLGVLHSTSCFPRETAVEEASNGVNDYGGEKRNGTVLVEDIPAVEKNLYNQTVSKHVTKEDVAVDEQEQTLEFSEIIKLDSVDAYSLLLYGGGGSLVALWLASAVVSALDSIPLLPKLMEVVGLGYTFWFTTRYLLFKKNREELEEKVEEIKRQVLGSDGNRPDQAV